MLWGRVSWSLSASTVEEKEGVGTYGGKETDHFPRRWEDCNAEEDLPPTGRSWQASLFQDGGGVEGACP